MDNETPPDLIDTRTFKLDVAKLAENVKLSAAVLRTVREHQQFAEVLDASVDSKSPEYAALLKAIKRVEDECLYIKARLYLLSQNAHPSTPDQ